MCDFQVTKRFEHRSFEENVTRHGSCIIGSIENAEISVFLVTKRCSKRCISVTNIALKIIHNMKIM